MAQNLVVISMYPDRLEASSMPKVRARVEPLRVVVHWLDDETWGQVSVGHFVRVDGSPVETVPPDPLFRHEGTEPAQDVNFTQLEREDVGAHYKLVATSSTRKDRLEQTFDCWLLGFESGKNKTAFRT